MPRQQISSSGLGHRRGAGWVAVCAQPIASDAK